MNYFVDSYDVFDNDYFKKFGYKDRISSSIKLDNYKYDTIIVGTSRTQRGVDVRNSLLNGKVLNASMSGSNVFEIHKVFNKIYKTQNNGIDIIYGIDFLTFNNKRLPSEQFYQSLYNIKSSKISLYFSLLFSTDSIKSSLKTIIKNIIGSKSYNVDGFKIIDNKKFNYKKAFKEILTNNFLIIDGTYGCFNYGEDRLRLFEEIVKNSKNKNLYLFISPLHYRQIIALKHLGLFDIYINWIYDLYSIVHKYNSKEYNVKLYDFSYINEITTEPVSNDVKYYWESSHYKPIVGNMIIEKLFNNNEQFGVLLNNIEIKQYLYNYINRYYTFFEKEEQTYKDVYNLYLKTTKKRKKSMFEV